ncbi:lipase maturation factor family protein [Paracidobacterium acidisoli]|uniref:Lipase maturation factor family protein n=1 Tax=Paracidobacterium acidisoli TaxID=2303751 RepID=A0A372ITH4_9BACT|nr:lipase maturation factor family protein [Paracidobacterium acidisoli]MBT9329489.1 lipase maturation factor family protein [Paracidobacterium acidisoli]
MDRSPATILRWLFGSQSGLTDRQIPRWIFLRTLAAIYFSAFFSLLFQIKGLIGPQGILPAQQYLAAVAEHLGSQRFWYAPTLFWLSSGSHMLMAVTWIGLAASVVALFNLWPRLCFALCFVCFLSFVSAAGDFSGYQSDGMLLEAGFIALFFTPGGLLPGWGERSPVRRAALFLLLWEWFRIYFESGIVKLLSGDPEWRSLTAMDEYYQNGPLPTWIGWYVQHLPHWFHVATAAGTLVMELGIVWMLFLPRRLRLICFFIVTPWEIGVILTANYTFLNYLVLCLGFLLLDDRSIRWLVPTRWRSRLPREVSVQSSDNADQTEPVLSILSAPEGAAKEEKKPAAPRRGTADHLRALRLAVVAVLLTWIAYDTTAELLRMPFPDLPLPSGPVIALEPLRIANRYGLFAVMTRGRYEIEFQGSNDGQNWTPYPFRNKPQALNEAPRIYAPYQPRFDWNLWFASLGDWQQYQIVPMTEERLLEASPDVLALFRSNPFAQAPPRYVRAVLWQYWFTSMAEKKSTGNWWRREPIGLYAPVLTRTVAGKFGVVQWPEPLPQHN